jgi:hypothetical protein
VNREPDDPERPREPTSSDVDAAFAQIVASWQEPPPQWPSDESDPSGRSDQDDDAAPTEEIPAVAADLAPPAYEDDDHFVPPEPPPLPRPQPATVGAVLLFALGIVLLTIPNMIGFSEQYGLPLGLLSITGAIVWLVARLRQGPPTDSGWDDGAQL